MAHEKQQPERAMVAPELTWDLTTIFATDEAFSQALKDLDAEAEAVKALSGTVGKGADQLLTALTAVFTITRHLEKAYVYAELKNDQDTGDSRYQEMKAQAQSRVAAVTAADAWLEPEILAIPEATLQSWIDRNPELQAYNQFFRSLNTQRGHVLSPESERLLAASSEIFDASSRTFGVLTNADLTFPMIEDEEGNTVEISEGLYGVLIQSTDRRVRREAFEGLYQVFHQFRNTLASTLAGEVKVHNLQAKEHYYESARDQALSSNHIPTAVYDTLVTSVDQHLDLLHRYVALRKQILQLPELHMYDLYTPITGEPSLAPTYESAQQTIVQALQVMGPDYVGKVENALKSRYIDVVANKGKRSGAYSSGMYDTNPFILLNWQDNLDNLYTLIHEMGHSMHSAFTRENQPYQTGDYSIFVAEIASTTNENLLTDYLLNHVEDDATRAYILNYYLDGFKGTVYRQTQFAEFEHYIHEQDAAGQPLTAEFMSRYYGQLNEKYYGDAVISDEQIADEWTRIPHFYYDYYVYQYATGFAAATTLSKGIATGQVSKRDDYLDFLKAGNSAFPLEVMKKAGVDMTNATYLEDAFKTFEDRLNEFEKLMTK